MGCKFAAVLLVALLAPSSAFSQDKPPPVPPGDALKLSAIIATVEQRDSFHYVYDVEWNDDGYYDVIYFTTDKAKVEMKIDAVTGKAR
jgi:peptidase YpeB-like protein